MMIEKDSDKILTECDICKEVFVVLSHFDNKILRKIPDKLFNMLIESASYSSKNVYFDMNKPLKNQNISNEAKDFISLIYYDYLVDADEKKEIHNYWSSSSNY